MSALITSKRLVAAAFLMLLGLSACNTMEGAGEDIQSGGRALENSAERNK
jgi:entericidin B